MKNKKIKILMHTQPNITSFNAQDLNGREIASRLNEEIFEIYFIDLLGTEIDPKLQKDNIHILNAVSTNKILRKLKIFKYKLLYKYDISFYIRVFKSESYFLKLKPFFDKKRITIHMVENMLPYPASKKYNETAKYNALNSNYVFAISNKIKDDIKREYGIEVPIIHVGVNTNIFKPIKNKISNNRLKVISCGSLQSRKQPLLFAKIAKEFKDVDFIWIGEGELKNEVLEYVKNLDNFTLLSNMSHEKLSQYFIMSNMFLFPSVHEGFPKVVVESMACGLPSVVFDRYEPEAVLDNQTGFIVKDEEEMKSKLKLLIENDKIREEFSQNAVKRAQNYSWDKIVRKWEEFILDETSK